MSIPLPPSLFGLRDELTDIASQEHDRGHVSSVLLHAIESTSDRMKAVVTDPKRNGSSVELGGTIWKPEYAVHLHPLPHPVDRIRLNQRMLRLSDVQGMVSFDESSLNAQAILSARYLHVLGAMLCETFGDDVLDLAWSFHCHSNSHVRKDLPAEERKKLIEGVAPTEEQKYDAMTWVLNFNSARIEKHAGKSGESLLKVFMRVLERRENVRYLAKETLAMDVRLPDLLVVQGAVREGFRTLQHARSVSDYEWWKRLHDVAVAREATIAKELRDCSFPADQLSELILKQKQELVRTTETLQAMAEPKPADHPVPKVEWTPEAAELVTEVAGEMSHIILGPKLVSMEDVDGTRKENMEKMDIAARKLRFMLPIKGGPLEKEIEAARFRKRLEKLRAEYNPMALGAAEAELMHKVLHAIMRYPHGSFTPEFGLLDFERSFRMSFPANVAREKHLSCYSGPWLAAALMMKAGIPQSQLFLLQTHEMSESTYGSHAALVLNSSAKQLPMLDYGAHCVRHLPAPDLLPSEYESAHLKYLLNGKTQDAVTIRLDPALATMQKVPAQYRLLPLEEGFMAGHVFHTGLAFLNEGKFDEAKEAFLLGLALDPNNPDLLYHLGYIAEKQFRKDEAATYYERCLVAYPRHLEALTALGIIECEREHPERAIELLKAVKNDKRTPFANSGYKNRAITWLARTRYLSGIDSE